MIGEVLKGRSGAQYVVEAEIGSGGQATVYRGRGSPDSGSSDKGPSDNRAVALKVALFKGGQGRRVREEREHWDAILRSDPSARSWLVAVLDDGETSEGRVFLVLPLYDSGMEKWIVGGASLELVLVGLEKAAQAVVQLHRAPVADDTGRRRVHRDIKVENFLVRMGPGGLEVVLADLGGLREGDVRELTNCTTFYTEHYAPLDQQLPVRRELNPHWDVHALAVMVYVCLVGAPPPSKFEGVQRLTAAGMELQALHYERARGKLDPADRPRYDELCLLDITDLIRLDADRQGEIADRAKLVERLSRKLADRLPGTAAATATAMANVLIPHLEHAWDVNPDRRAGDADRIWAALGKARRVLLEALKATPSTRTSVPLVSSVGVGSGSFVAIPQLRSSDDEPDDLTLPFPDESSEKGTFEGGLGVMVAPLAQAAPISPAVLSAPRPAGLIAPVVPRSLANAPKPVVVLGRRPGELREAEIDAAFGLGITSAPSFVPVDGPDAQTVVRVPKVVSAPSLPPVDGPDALTVVRLPKTQEVRKTNIFVTGGILAFGVVLLLVAVVVGQWWIQSEEAPPRTAMAEEPQAVTPPPGPEPEPADDPGEELVGAPAPVQAEPVKEELLTTAPSTPSEPKAVPPAVSAKSSTKALSSSPPSRKSEDPSPARLTEEGAGPEDSQKLEPAPSPTGLPVEPRTATTASTEPKVPMEPCDPNVAHRVTLTAKNGIGAKIYIDRSSEPVGSAPLINFELSCGKHRIKMLLNDRMTAMGQLVVSDAGPAQFRCEWPVEQGGAPRCY